jgi:hypothetical protein
LTTSGHYTAPGLRTVLKPDVEHALAQLNELQGAHLAPRRAALQARLAAVPGPTAPQLDELERHRLVNSFVDATPDDRTKLLNSASPKLAAALLAEDGAVVSLTPERQRWLRTRAFTDEHADARAELERQLFAVEAADKALQGAAVNARRHLEDNV